jgi:bacterioferritin
MKKPEASPRLAELMNAAIARELQVSIQYMWQHVLWRGVQGFAVKDEFRKISIQEMKHAEHIAERLFYLGVKPTTKPWPIVVGETLREMIELDVKAEEEAVELYTEIVVVTREEGDETTNHLFRDILADEEEHHDLFTSLLEDL